MRTINAREDICLLVNTFYTQVRKDTVIGPVFNTLIKEEDWPAHLSRMVDFWECNLFFRPTFKGNPGKKHQQVDAGYSYGTNETHYERWVELWCHTVDEHFEGKIAGLAKIRAINMGKQLLTKVYQAKPVNLSFLLEQ